MIKFIFYSYIFRRIIISTIIFIPVIWIVNISYDFMWHDVAAIPLVDLYDVYSPPPSYDNTKKIRMKLLNQNRMLIEANRRFKLMGKNDTTYCDSTQILLPDSSTERTNKIFFQFRNSPYPDSIYVTITNTEKKNIYWNQIFYSSVQISELNEFKIDTEDFRIKASNLVSRDLLNDNDTLINQCIKYFNNNINKSKIADCGTNSSILKSICDEFSLPCRQITLMGGDANELGYNDYLGYPSHEICEVYSSKYKKWYVLDPTYGLKLRKGDIPLNALQISDAVFFNEVSNITQDSVFFTRRSLVGRDYFKFYENVYYPSNIQINIVLRQIIRRFFTNFYYLSYHYTNVLNIRKNGRVYLGAKAFIYIIFLLLYIISIMLILGVRLYKDKANYRKT